MHLADRETLPGSLVAFAASRRQVPRIDRGARIGRGQDIVDPVATRAVGHGFVAFFGRQPVEGSVEAHHAVLGKAEAPRQPHVSVAIPAGLPDVAGVHRRSCVAGRQDGVLAVTVGTDGRLRNALGQRLTVHALAELLGYLAVAHPASLRHFLPEPRRLGPHQFMRAAVAHRAIRRGSVAALGGLPVYPALIVRLLLLVALAADRLGDVRRVRIFLVLHMAGGAGHLCVRAFPQLGALIVMAGSARRVVRGARRRCGRGHP